MLSLWDFDGFSLVKTTKFIYRPSMYFIKKLSYNILNFNYSLFNSFSL